MIEDNASEFREKPRLNSEMVEPPMEVLSPRNRISWLLSQLIGTYVSADRSADSGDFSYHLDHSRQLVEMLREVALQENDPANPETASPPGLLDFLDAAERATATGQTPEDRELLGLTEWAERLFEEARRPPPRLRTA